MAAPPVASPLPQRSLPTPPTAMPAFTTSARTTSTRDVILLDDDEVKQPPVVHMQTDEDDDVTIIHSTTATAPPTTAAQSGAATAAGTAGSINPNGTPRNGYSLVSSLKEKLFGGWNNNGSLQPPNSGSPSSNIAGPSHASTQSSSTDDSSSSCGAFSLCSPSSSSSSPVMKRQRSNDDMGVPPIVESPPTASVNSSMPPVPPPHPNFHLAAFTPPSTLPPLPAAASSAAASSPSPNLASTASTNTNTVSSSSPSPTAGAPAVSLPSAMSDEELARFLQSEDEAFERRQREQRQRADEAAFQQFQLDQGTCSLCHTHIGAELILEMVECGHRVCADCLREYLQLWRSSSSPTCPCHATSGGGSVQCSVVVPERVMRQVLTSEQLNELQERQMKAFLSASSSSYVTCPQCHETFEAIATSSSAASTPRASTASGGVKETAEDGRELTSEQLDHRNRHRFRCVSCSANFCRLCQTTPYHLGYTCDEYQRYTNAPHCRYCEDVLLDTPATTAASTSSTSSSAPAASASTSFVARILRSSSKKDNSSAHEPPPPIKAANVCSKPECLDKYSNQCIKLLPVCRHPCDGVRGERHCLPCMHEDCERHRADAPTRDEFCNICYAESLAQAPCIQLKCGHIFHYGCAKTKLDKRWPTPRVTFHFMSCPLCNAQIEHPSLNPTLQPLLALKAQVQQKASDRLSFEGNQNDAPLQKGGKYEGRPADYAMDLYAYYMCSHCHQPYFGGRRQCEEAAAARADEAYNEKDLVCGGCVLTEGGGNGCTKHGKEFIEYKCATATPHSQQPLRQTR